jgi:serine phosphatase RsbU (regulator of sigma subunit)
MRVLSKLATQRYEHPLAYRLLFYILLCSSIFTILATALQLFFDYKRDVSFIEERMVQIETSYLTSLTNSVWMIDPKAVELQLQGILSLPDIKYLEIKSSDPYEHYTAGKQPSKYTATIKRSFPMRYTIEGETYHLTTLEVIASLEGVYQRLIDKTLVILVTQAIKTFLVSLFILFIVQYLITRHLGKMASYARQLDLEHLHVPLNLTRKNKNRKDELEQVVNAINDMRETLIEDIRKRKEAEETKQKLQLENEHLKTELEVTRRLQQMILPKEQELSEVPNLAIAGFMESADEVGGDYYDVLQQNDRFLIGIGDVTGHGLESGMLMLMAQAGIRTLWEHEEIEIVNFFNSLNRMLYKNAQERLEVDKNLTLSLLEYQPTPTGGVLRISGRHEDILLVRAGQLERINTGDLGFQVGFVDDIAELVKQIEVPLTVGDVVVLYTDGITEAENLERQEYGIKRLSEVVIQNWQGSVKEIRQAVIADVRQHIGQQKVFDDMTLVVLKPT